MKPCKKCGAKDRNNSGRCRPCHSAYYQANKEKINSRSLARYYQNRERALELNRKWRAENPDKERSATLKRYAANPELRERVRKWNVEHPERAREHQRQYSVENADRRKENTARWRKANPDKVNAQTATRRAYRLKCEGTHTALEWAAVLSAHGNKCARCGTRDGLQKDHIIPLSRGGTNFAYNLQPLCKPCNIAKYNHIRSGAQHSLFDRVSE